MGGRRVSPARQRVSPDRAVPCQCRYYTRQCCTVGTTKEVLGPRTYFFIRISKDFRDFYEILHKILLWIWILIFLIWILIRSGSGFGFGFGFGFDLDLALAGFGLI